MSIVQYSFNAFTIVLFARNTLDIFREMLPLYKCHTRITEKLINATVFTQANTVSKMHQYSSVLQ